LRRRRECVLQSPGTTDRRVAGDPGGLSASRRVPGVPPQASVRGDPSGCGAEATVVVAASQRARARLLRNARRPSHAPRRPGLRSPGVPRGRGAPARGARRLHCVRAGTCAGAASFARADAVEALQEFVDNFTYLGVFAVLLLGSLGVPIPEEMPIIAAAVLSHEGIVRWWLALPVCLLGVLSGDMVLYWVGRHWGEQVLNLRLVRLVLSRSREQWLNAAYRRHALKTVVTARHVMGLRAVAFLTAGRANVPFWKFVVADAGAAVLLCSA